jgi:hypothetical protein
MQTKVAWSVRNTVGTPARPLIASTPRRWIEAFLRPQRVQEGSPVGTRRRWPGRNR